MSKVETSLNTRRFLALVFVLFFVWMIFAQFFASREALRAIDAYHIDKAFHFLGGIWIVGALARVRTRMSSRLTAVKRLDTAPRRIRNFAVLLFVLVIGVLWEVVELAVFPEVRHLFRDLYPYWLSDTAGDIVLDMLGGACALFWMNRRV
ncbi:MAG: hypothetical protein AAB915_01505 [Patescibacteria group bacterium]